MDRPVGYNPDNLNRYGITPPAAAASSGGQVPIGYGQAPVVNNLRMSEVTHRLFTSLVQNPSPLLNQYNNPVGNSVLPSVNRSEVRRNADGDSSSDSDDESFNRPITNNSSLKAPAVSPIVAPIVPVATYKTYAIVCLEEDVKAYISNIQKSIDGNDEFFFRDDEIERPLFSRISEQKNSLFSADQRQLIIDIELKLNRKIEEFEAYQKAKHLNDRAHLLAMSSGPVVSPPAQVLSPAPKGIFAKIAAEAQAKRANIKAAAKPEQSRALPVPVPAAAKQEPKQLPVPVAANLSLRPRVMPQAAPAAPKSPELQASAPVVVNENPVVDGTKASPSPVINASSDALRIENERLKAKLAAYDAAFKGIKEDLDCPLSLDTFKDPVIDEFGDTFERKDFVSYKQNNKTSPINRKEYVLNSVTPNRAVKSIVEKIEKLEKQFPASK